MIDFYDNVESLFKVVESKKGFYNFIINEIGEKYCVEWFDKKNDDELNFSQPLEYNKLCLLHCKEQLFKNIDNENLSNHYEGLYQHYSRIEIALLAQLEYLKEIKSKFPNKQKVKEIIIVDEMIENGQIKF